MRRFLPFRFPDVSRFRWALATTAFALFLSCHSDHNAPTQPGVVPSPTPVGMVPSPTPVGMVPTATPSAAAHMVNVGQGGRNSFVDPQSGNSTTTIKAGQTVQWVWMGGPHSSTSGNCCTPDGKWDSGLMSSGTFSQTFPAAGSFPYFCTVHGSMMTGMVVVSP
jgi:plastocyanin